MAVRLLILVKDRTFADVLGIRLEAEPDIDVVAALHKKAFRWHLLTGSRVDVVLLDGDLYDDAAVRLCEEFSHRGEAPRVILLSHSADPGRMVRALRAGAAGWVCKDESLLRLIDVIRGVARKETWLPPAHTGQVLRLLLHGPDLERDGSSQLLATLTDREREVLVCLAEGIRRQDVAKHLHMSPNTVRTHLQNLMGKLGVHSAIEAVALTRSPSDDQLSHRRVVS
jgi:DNA-binding NarL/FixJ family response regulator